MYLFPTNALYSLKSFISATSKVNFYFFLLLLGFGEEDPKGASCQDDQQQFFNVFNQDAGVFFFGQFGSSQKYLNRPLIGNDMHKTSRSRVHHAKIHLIILHVPTFFMGFCTKCLRSGPLNLQRQVVCAEGKTRYMKFELFQNSCCHFSPFQIRCNIEDSAKMHSTTICKK